MLGSIPIILHCRGFHLSRSAVALRRSALQRTAGEPAPELARVGLKDIVDHYEKAAASLSEVPLLVGHSFGGLVAQLLLERKVGAGAIAIHSAPPRGVFPSLPALRSGFPVLLSLGGWRRVLRTSFDSFAHGFIHNLPPDEQRSVYEEQVIPTPGRPFFQVAFASFNAASKIDFARSGRTPLLIVAGDGDRTVTASMNRPIIADTSEPDSRSTTRSFRAVRIGPSPSRDGKTLPAIA